MDGLSFPIYGPKAPDSRSRAYSSSLWLLLRLQNEDNKSMDFQDFARRKSLYKFLLRNPHIQYFECPDYLFRLHDSRLFGCSKVLEKAKKTAGLFQTSLFRRRRIRVEKDAATLSLSGIERVYSIHRKRMAIRRCALWFCYRRLYRLHFKVYDETS